MAIYHPSEDSGRGLTTYCAEDDIYLLMEGIMPDAEGDALQAFASSSTLTRILNSAMLTTKLKLDNDCGRDFDYHAAVAVAIDGVGTDEADLGHVGFWPLLDVDSISVDGSSLTLADYTWDQAGVVKPNDYWGGYPIFTRGYRNVAMTITWGYTAPPADVVMAQAKLVGVEVLTRIVAANAAEPGMIGGSQRVQFGDLIVNNYSRGRFSPTIDEWKADVKDVVAKYRRLATVRALPKIYDDTATTRLKHFDDD